MENFSLGLRQWLYAKVPKPHKLDIELAHFTQRLATYIRCTCGDEKIIWEGTEHWDTLPQRAAITGN
jgi:hypothetical protein